VNDSGCIVYYDNQSSKHCSSRPIPHLYSLDNSEHKRAVKAFVRNAINNGPYVFKRRLSKGLMRTSRESKPSSEYADFIVENAPKESNFLDRIRRESLGKLAFLDGYFVFEDKTFYPWGTGPGMKTLVTTNTCFPKQPTEEKIQTMYQKVLYPVFDVNPDDTGSLQYEKFTYVMNMLCKALAGQAGKEYIIGTGARNSAKSTTVKLVANAFGGDYVKPVKAGNFYDNANASSDEAKQQSFLVGHMWSRIMYFCENKGTDRKMSGELVKQITGQDKQVARTNSKDELYFYLQCMMWWFCNDMPEMDSPDALETARNIKFPCAFTNEGKPDYEKYQQQQNQFPDGKVPNNRTVYKLGDDTVVDELPDFAPIFAWELLHKFSPTRNEPKRTQDLIDDMAELLEVDEEEQKFHELFWMGTEHCSEEDTMTNKEMDKHIEHAYGRLPKPKRTKRYRWMRNAGVAINEGQRLGSRENRKRRHVYIQAKHGTDSPNDVRNKKAKMQGEFDVDML
jgi:hypothetical protein